jgi:Icc-related predicted phosphoesterase
MLIGAFGDVHSDENLALLRAASATLSKCELLLLAGDITDSNDLEGYGRVVAAIRELSDAEIVAVFGNEEYDISHAEYRERLHLIFLEDEAREFDIEGMKIKVVGTTGSLDRPTWWQRANVPEIWKRYRDRVTKVSALLERGDSDLLILLMHYAPTYRTLEGERQMAFPEMGSLLFEEAVTERAPDAVIHAHAHRGRRSTVLTKRQRSLEDFSGSAAEVPVYNVSLPARGGPTFFEIGMEGNASYIREVR